MRYLKGTIGYDILYSGFSTVLEGYSDTNWITDLDEKKFTNGYVFTLSGGAISSKSAKQTIITQSTIEYEFIALEVVEVEVDRLRNFLAKKGITKIRH